MDVSFLNIKEDVLSLFSRGRLMFAIGSFSRVVYAFVLVAVFTSACEAGSWTTPAGTGVTYDSQVTFEMKI